MIRCWWCGVEPAELHEITDMDTREVVRVVQWPDGNHEHSDQPPTPAELEESGYLTMARMLRRLVD